MPIFISKSLYQVLHQFYNNDYWKEMEGVLVVVQDKIILKGNDILLIGFLPLQFKDPRYNPYKFLLPFIHICPLSFIPFINTNMSKTNLNNENSWIWIFIIVIQKTATNEESKGEADKDATPLSDRAASLDISKESSLKIEGSGMEDVDAEGVRYSYLI